MTYTSFIAVFKYVTPSSYPAMDWTEKKYAERELH